MDYTLLDATKDIFPYKSIEKFTQSGTLEILAAAGAVAVGFALIAKSWLRGVKEYDERTDEMMEVNQQDSITPRVLFPEERDAINRARTYIDITTRQI